MVPVNFSVSSEGARKAMLHIVHGEFLQPRARGEDRGRYYLLYEEERKIFAKTYLV